MEHFRLRARRATIVVAALLLLGGATEAGAAPFGNALLLDGVNDYASVADNPALDLGDVEGEDFTLESSFYVPDESSDANQVIFWKQYAYALTINFNPSTSDAVIFRFWSAPFGSGSTLLNTTNLTVGWHHVAAVFDNEWSASNDRAAIYLDGAELASTTAFELTPGIYNSTNTLSVGANTGAAAFHGWLDETRFSDTARYSGSYTVPAGPFAADQETRALWRFDDAACVTSLADSSGNGNPLAAQNGATTSLPGAGPPELRFADASPAVGEGAGPAIVTVERTGDPLPAVGVAYAATDGTAGDGVDYTAASGSLAFGCGETSKTFEIAVAQDALFEGAETVNLALTGPTGGASLGSPAAATLTITDDDARPTLQFARASYATQENGGTLRLTVTRLGATGNEVGVSYAVAGGTATPTADFALAPGTLTFASGELSKTISVAIRNDAAQEAAETIVVALSAPAGGAALRSPSRATVTIARSDQQPDAWIGLGPASGFIGDNVYNTSGVGQTKQLERRRGAKGVFYVRVYNDGSAANTVRIRGAVSPIGATVAYFIGTSSTNVTTAVQSPGGWAVSLAPGAYRMVRVEILVGPTAVIGSSKTAWVSGTWTGDSVRSDTAKAVVKVV